MIETTRLILRPFREEDAADLCLHRGLQPAQPESLQEAGHAPGRLVHGIRVLC